MESSGHYWMPLASHLARRGVPVALVNPLAGEVLCEEPPGPDQVGPGRCPEPRRDGHARSAPRSAIPSPGLELRQAARFAMTLVRAGEGLPAAHRLVELGFPGARRAVRRPHLPDRPGGAPPAPTATRRAPTDAHPRRCQPGAGSAASGAAKARSACRRPGGRLDRGARAGRRGGLRGGPAARPVRPAGAPDRAADAHVAALLDGELARRLQTIPGWVPRPVAALIAEIGDIGRFDRLRPAARLCRVSIPPSAARAQGRQPRDRPGTCPRPATPTCARRPTGSRSWASSTTRSSPPTTPASARPARAR